MKIAINEITIDPAVAIRQGTDEDTIQRYMDTFAELPPIVVYQTNHKYLLADGFHRWAAASRLGHNDIEAEVRQGNYEAASEYAIYANLKHGKPLSREEYKNAVRRLNLLHPDWGSFKLAKAINRSHNFINTVVKVDEFRQATMVELDDRVVLEISRAPASAHGLIAQAAQEQGWTVEQTANVVAILKTQPDKLEEIIGIPKSQLNQTLDATLAEINHKTKEAITAIQVEIKTETPEDLKNAAKTLYKEASKREKAELTSEQKDEVEAKRKAVKEAKKATKAQQEKEYQEKYSALPKEERRALIQAIKEDDPEFLNELNKQTLQPPHVSQNTGENEWYTPQVYIDAAKEVMGIIDLDPASSSIANKTVEAKTFYSIQDDGRKKEWMGNIWLNPPYAQPLITQFCDLLVKNYKEDKIQQACVLVNNATETNFYQNMLFFCNAVCFIKGRIKFIDKQGNESGAPLQGQTVLYFGSNRDKFAQYFGKFGVVLYAR